MAFPSSPIDGQLYTNALGTQYSYVLADTAWKIVGGGGGGGTIKGSGTAGYLAKFTDATTIGNSVFNTTGTQVCLLSTYNNPGSDGSNIYIGGGGQDSTGVDSFGSANTALGVDALLNVQDGYSNVAIGKNALRSETTGMQSVAIGKDALTSQINGNSNVAIGVAALQNQITAGGNTVIGNQAGAFYGPESDLLTNAVNCTYVGAAIVSGDQSASNEIIIGASDGVTIGLGSFSAMIGNVDTTKTALFGNLGIDNTSPVGILHPIAVGDSLANNLCGNVGPADASSGTFTRDSTQYPTFCREDTGTLTDDGVLKIVGTNTTGERFTGFGFVWASSLMESLGSMRSMFSFSENDITLTDTVGAVVTTDTSDSLCILAEPGTGSTSSSLSIKNRNGQESRIGYWVKYWWRPQ